jgi:hypothetical protein
VFDIVPSRLGCFPINYILTPIPAPMILEASEKAVGGVRRRKQDLPLGNPF